MKLAVGLFSFAFANPAAEDWAFRVWTEKADEVFEYANANANDFVSAVNSQPDSFFKSTWKFCDENDDEIVSASEYMSCGERVTELIGSSDPGFQAKTDAIMDKYWYFFDKDRSDSLSWDEWRYANSAFAVVDALVILEAFDADRDQSLNPTEQNAWRSKMREMFSAIGYQPTPEQHAAMVAAWALSQTDDDPSASLIELSRFNLLLWDSFYQ